LKSLLIMSRDGEIARVFVTVPGALWSCRGAEPGLSREGREQEKAEPWLALGAVSALVGDQLLAWGCLRGKEVSR